MPFPFIPVALALLGGAAVVRTVNEFNRPSGSYTRSITSRRDDGEARRREAERREKERRRITRREEIEDLFNRGLYAVASSYAQLENGRFEYSMDEICRFMDRPGDLFDVALGYWKNSSAEAFREADLIAERAGTFSAAAKRLSDNAVRGVCEPLEKVIPGAVLAEIEERLLTEAEAALEAMASGVPMIVNTGLLKAGKSSLFNALFGHDGLFAYRSVRATVVNQEEMMDGVKFIDTPGIDAQDSDRETALEAIRIADLVVYAFNLNCGGLEKVEIDHLKGIASRHENAGGMFEKIVFVGTNLDKIEDAAHKVIEAVKKQIFDAFGARTEPICISATRCLKGIDANKPLLVEKSNVATLRRILFDRVMAGDARVKSEREKRYATSISAIAVFLESKADAASKDALERTYSLEREAEEMSSDLKRLIDTVRTEISAYWSI